MSSRCLDFTTGSVILGQLVHDSTGHPLGVLSGILLALKIAIAIRDLRNRSNKK